MYYAYVLHSTKTNKYYFGHTQNLDERLKQHNAGKVRSTKARRPWQHPYYETFKTRSEAYQREMYFKTIDGREWLKKEEKI